MKMLLMTHLNMMKVISYYLRLAYYVVSDLCSMNSPTLFLNFEAMGTRPELPDYLDIEGDEDYDEVLGD